MLAEARGRFLIPARPCPTPRCVRHEYEYCDVCVNRSDDNMLDVNRNSPVIPRPLHNSATKEIDNLANRADQ